MHYNKMKVNMVATLFFMLGLSACGSMTQITYTPRPTYTATPTNIVLPTETLLPTFTPTPTNTPTPTATVTPTLVPGALDCKMINSQHVTGITDLQWLEYTKTVIGKEVYFSGTIYNIYAEGVAYLIGTDLLCNFELYNIPLDQAITISKDQSMDGYGEITAIDYVDVVIIRLNVNLASLKIH
jgi:hypothetical protein